MLYSIVKQIEKCKNFFLKNMAFFTNCGWKNEIILNARNQSSIPAVTRDANLSIEREMLQKWLFWLENQKRS